MIVYATSKSMKWQSDKLTQDFILQYAKDTSVHDTIYMYMYMYLKPHLHANSQLSYWVCAINIEKLRMGQGTRLMLL